MTRLRGRALRGKRLYASAPQSHWHTTTMICSMRLDGSTACMAVEGAPIRSFSELTCAESCAQHYARAMWSSWTTFHRTKALKLLGLSKSSAPMSCSCRLTPRISIRSRKCGANSKSFSAAPKPVPSLPLSRQWPRLWRRSHLRTP